MQRQNLSFFHHTPPPSQPDFSIYLSCTSSAQAKISCQWRMWCFSSLSPALFIHSGLVLPIAQFSLYVCGQVAPLFLSSLPVQMVSHTLLFLCNWSQPKHKYINKSAKISSDYWTTTATVTDTPFSMESIQRKRQWKLKPSLDTDFVNVHS